MVKSEESDWVMSCLNSGTKGGKILRGWTLVAARIA